MHTHTFCVLLSTLAFAYDTAASFLEPVIENVVHLQTAHPPPDTPGIWKKKLIWKARWVQEWKTEKKWRPVWRKVWSPVEIREWVPIPRPPPDFHPSESGPPPHAPAAASSPHDHHDLPSYPPIPHGHEDPEGPQGPPPFRPIPSGPTGPPNSYGPPSPQNLGPSTALHPVPDAPPAEWPAPNMQELLANYHTIRDPNADSYNNLKPERPEQVSYNNYHVSSPNPERQRLPQFFEPPKQSQQHQQQQQQQQLYRPPTNSTSPFRDVSPRNQETRNSVSPYAAKLAQAVIREKLNQSQKPTERPSGLTDVVFKPSQSSTTTAKTPSRVTKGAASSTENPSNVYIVTPVSFG